MRILSIAYSIQYVMTGRAGGPRTYGWIREK